MGFTPPTRDTWIAVLESDRAELERREAQNVEAARKALPKFERAVLLFGRSISNCLVEFEKNRAATDRDLVWVLMVSKAKDDILATWSELSRGRYGSAHVLMRAIYECWLLLQYLAAFPSDAGRWWLRGGAGRLDRDLEVGAIKGKLLDTNAIPPVERDVYAVLSEMAHPSGESVVAYVQPALKNGEIVFSIDMVRPFVPQVAEAQAKCLVELGLRILRFIAARFPGATGGPGAPLRTMADFEATSRQIEKSLGLDDPGDLKALAQIYRINRT